MTSPMNLAEADATKARINAFRELRNTLVAKPSTPARLAFIAECEAEILALNTQLAEAGWL